MLDIEQDLITLVAEAAKPKQVDESIADIASAATVAIGGAAAAGLAMHTVHNFMNKFSAPKENDSVKHKETGQEGKVKFVHANGKLNVDWHDGSNTSHDKSEVSLNS